ncbi:MAG: hypothetical protein JWR83_3228 [Aeromicrobium sp.]|nr:hypothetical protein [Aeromicrobium sp.]
MTEDRWAEDLAQLIDDHVTGSETSREGLDAAHSAEAAELLNIADLLWDAAHGAPPLEQDPVAAMLGLVPDSTRALNAVALKRALQASGMQVSVVAKMLSARGWDVTTRDVFGWQTRETASAPPALIQALAEVLGVAPDRLIIDKGESAAHRALKSITTSPGFRELTERWAALRGTTIDLAASALESRLATSVYRGGEPDERQMIASLEALISALESESRRDERH